nr:replication factor A carboxy-terminal domain protein [Tanacetum cinerariifolium]
MSFFNGMKDVNLEQLMDVFEPCACVALATITSIEYEEWWFTLHVEEKATKPTAAEYPDDLNKLIGKTLLFRVDVSRYNLINNYAVYTVGRMTSCELHIKSFIKLYADEMVNVNKDAYNTDVNNEETISEITQTPILETSTPSKLDVESSMAENVVKVEPDEGTATPL